jgi:hypothetical protein
LGLSASTATAGQPVTFTVVVAPAGGTGTPTGTVTFWIDGLPQAPALLAAVAGQAIATLSDTSLAPGIHAIAASYNGDSTFGPSPTTPPQSLTIAQAPKPTPSPKPAPSPSPTLSPTPPPPVIVTGVSETMGKKHRVTDIVIDFSGPLDAADAQQPGLYLLTIAGKKGSFTARNARHIPLKSVSYDPSRDAVTLVLRKPVAVTKPVQLRIEGTPPSGLRDSRGRFIDGADAGRPGSDAIVVLGPHGATISRAVERPGVALRRLQPTPSLFGERPFHRIARRPF